MRTKLLLLLLVFGFAFVSCEKDDDSLNRGNSNNPKFSVTDITAITSVPDGDCEPTVTDLVAGQHHKVGTVKVENDENYLIVTYTIENAEWCITETHLHIGMTAEDFPFAGRTSNPVPGQFDHKGYHDCETEVVYMIHKDDLPDLLNGTYYIAAHAVVQKEVSGAKADLEKFAGSLPEEVTVNIKTFPGGATLSYFENIHIGGDSFLNGTDYKGWCVESSLGINPNTYYQAKVYSSYDDDLPAGIVEQPENLAKLNWLLNQHFVGKDAGNGLGNYTFKDLQVAIWKMIAFYPTAIQPDGIGDDFSQERVDKLIAMANEKGAGFVPSCGDLIVLLLEIEGAQNIIITTPLKCFSDETAWGKGYRFTERGNWAMYFTHKWMVCENGGDDENGETAFGGDYAGEGSAWWYYFDASGPATQKIYAGQKETDGTVTITGGKLTINLGSWELKDVKEPVKVQGYNELPDKRPAAGQFKTYKGSELDEIVVGEYSYFVIHLDIKEQE